MGTVMYVSGEPPTYMYAANQPHPQYYVVGQYAYPQASVPFTGSAANPSANLPPYTESSTVTSHSPQAVGNTQSEDRYVY